MELPPRLTSGSSELKHFLKHFLTRSHPHAPFLAHPFTRSPLQATLLLTSATNPILSHTASCVIGNLYPAYASLKAVEYMRVRDEPYEATKWLMYWSVYGIFSAVEMIVVPPVVLRSMPYPILRLALTLWLQVPRFSGAYRVTVDYLRPILHTYYRGIDACVDKARESLGLEAYRPLLAWLEDAGRRVPLLEWFLRTPDGGRYIKDRRDDDDGDDW